MSESRIDELIKYTESREKQTSMALGDHNIIISQKYHDITEILKNVKQYRLDNSTKSKNEIML